MYHGKFEHWAGKQTFVHETWVRQQYRPLHRTHNACFCLINPKIKSLQCQRKHLKRESKSLCLLTCARQHGVNVKWQSGLSLATFFKSSRRAGSPLLVRRWRILLRNHMVSATYKIHCCFTHWFLISKDDKIERLGAKRRRFVVYPHKLGRRIKVNNAL